MYAHSIYIYIYMYVHCNTLQHTATHDLWWVFRIPICIRWPFRVSSFRQRAVRWRRKHCPGGIVSVRENGNSISRFLLSRTETMPPGQCCLLHLIEKHCPGGIDSVRERKNLDMGWLRLVGSLKLHVSFAKEPYKRDDILRKRPMILRSLLIVATPYYNYMSHVTRMNESCHLYFMFYCGPDLGSPD